VFNEEIKKMFMDNYDKSTQVSLVHIFKKSSELEEMLKKDIYEFNREELDDLFMSFGSRSEVSVASRISVINKYIDFAIEQGFVPSGINLVKNFSGEEYYKKYISKVAENRMILSKEDIKNLTYGSSAFCNNAQDAAIIVSLFVGGRGRQEKEFTLEELRNLKWEDCNEENNTVTFTRDNGETRIVPVETYVLEILKDANAQEKYLRNNGEVSDWSAMKKNNEMNLINTGYILRPTKKGIAGKVTKGTIVQRLNTIKQLYGNPFISVTNIWLSGMVEYGKKIKAEKGKELDKSDYMEICRRFGHNEVYWSKIKSRIKNYI
jgi:integrase